MMIATTSIEHSGRAAFTLVAMLHLALACTLVACNEDAPYTSQLSLDAGGDTTVDIASSHAFEQPAPNLLPATQALHDAGDVTFETVFQSASSPFEPGLGPCFNALSCASCHARDGRGKPGTDALLFRLSVPGANPDGSPLPAPDFGSQLQERAIFSVLPEGKVITTWTELPGQYGDGTPFSLRKPTYTITDPYTALPPGLLLSPRIAPPVFGLGLLEALDEATLLAMADPTDANGDGISGKLNVVWDTAAGALRPGRFGWKAEQPTLRQQSAGAYNQDMGVTSSVFDTESVAGQAQDDGLADDPEISDATLDATTAYVQTLGVPRRRADLPAASVLRGEQVFFQIGCESCHRAALVTGNSHPLVELRNQTIHAFTDLLLHDMGAGLADDRPAFDATGTEWRTPPLWGIGLLPVVNGHSNLLHDGRARTIAEAILWHDGEAAASRERFRTLNLTDRDALIAFLRSN